MARGDESQHNKCHRRDPAWLNAHRPFTSGISECLRPADGLAP